MTADSSSLAGAADPSAPMRDVPNFQSGTPDGPPDASGTGDHPILHYSRGP